MDLITLALCKKMVSSSTTGIQDIVSDKDGNLIFTLGDGTKFTVSLPILKPDNTSITVDEYGKISIDDDYITAKIESYLQNNTMSDEEIIRLFQD